MSDPEQNRSSSTDPTTLEPLDPTVASVGPDAPGEAPEGDAAPGEAGAEGVRAGQIRADRVEIRQGGAQRIEAGEVRVFQGGAGRVNADAITIDQGGIGFGRGTDVNLRNQSGAGILIARTAQLNEGSSVAILFARSVSGSVRPVLDWRSAAALGVGFAVARSLLGLVRR